jgi:hypothetical protein
METKRVRIADIKMPKGLGRLEDAIMILFREGRDRFGWTKSVILYEAPLWWDDMDGAPFSEEKPK